MILGGRTAASRIGDVKGRVFGEIGGWSRVLAGIA